ncbi:MAG: sugar kinase [Rhodospirillales bacterium]|nr:sugar kinase [Rhodospirillales bacterium]
MQRVAAIGECMIELSERDSGTLALAYGGDTLNTAVYLKRAANARIAVDYVTALGDDPWSEAMLSAWREEGLGTRHVARLPGGLPGLYMIRVEASGERRFYYWRSAAAARELFRAPATLPVLEALAEYDLVYLSLITVSVLGEEARERLASALATARSGGARVAFDTNYRPAGWPDPATARAAAERFIALADIALPTADDERALFGDADLEATASRYAGREAAVKRGADGCVVMHAQERREVAVPERVAAVDTTAAGDAFNAGYLAARLLGRAPEAAALVGHRLAAAVVRHPGAIIPRAAMPDLGLSAPPS